MSISYLLHPCLTCKIYRNHSIILGVVYAKALDKLKRQLADADAALEARKKPPEDTGPRIVGEGLVIDEWVSH